MDFHADSEALRQSLLEEIWAGASSGLGAMLLDEETIRQTGAEELKRLARQSGIR